MKKLFLLGFAFILFSLTASAQSKDGVKTYYDAAQTKLKELYEVQEVYTFGDDPSQAQVVQQKHGAYFSYYENGKLQSTGGYANGKKNGEWKYYDDKGKLTKLETYANGELQAE